MAKPKLVSPGPGYGKPMAPVRECMGHVETLILGLARERAYIGDYTVTGARVEVVAKVNIVTLVFNEDIEVEVRVLGGRRV